MRSSIAEPICSVEIAKSADVGTAVKAARAAFKDPEWSEMTPEGRGKLLYRIADLIEANKEELVAIALLSTGPSLTSSF
jgi:aldehyde dehydrogenase (NAD+)